MHCSRTYTPWPSASLLFWRHFSSGCCSSPCVSFTFRKKLATVACLLHPRPLRVLKDVVPLLLERRTFSFPPLQPFAVVSKKTHTTGNGENAGNGYHQGADPVAAASKGYVFVVVSRQNWQNCISTCKNTQDKVHRQRIMTSARQQWTPHEGRTNEPPRPSTHAREPGFFLFCWTLTSRPLHELDRAAFFSTFQLLFKLNLR